MDNGIFWNGSIDEKNQQQHYQSSNAQYHFGSYVQIEEQNFVFLLLFKTARHVAKMQTDFKEKQKL